MQCHFQVSDMQFPWIARQLELFLVAGPSLETLPLDCLVVQVGLQKQLALQMQPALRHWALKSLSKLQTLSQPLPATEAASAALEPPRRKLVPMMTQRLLLTLADQSQAAAV